MNLREALRTMSPSLTLQRAAADEIARLDAQVREQEGQLRALQDERDDMERQLDRALAR